MDDSSNNLGNPSSPIQPTAASQPISSPSPNPVMQPAPQPVENIPVSSPPKEPVPTPPPTAQPSTVANYNPLNPSVVAPISSPTSINQTSGVQPQKIEDVAPPVRQDQPAQTTPSSQVDASQPISTLSSANPPPVASQEPESKPKGQRNWRKIGIIAAIIFVLFLDFYAALDSGLIPNNIKLPVDVFKKAKTVQTTPVVSSLPAGFTTYEISGAGVTVAYPSVWGTPSIDKEKGYSKRSALLNSDGTFAYLVTFAQNTNVTVVATSSKYLSAPRTTKLYYDYLQWCNSGAGAYYQSLLGFSTAAGVESATLPACDQGPLVSVTKLDSSTIQRLNVAGSGDLYDKNLNNTDVPVLHVRDANRQNTANIKLLLANTKVL